MFKKIRKLFFYSCFLLFVFFVGVYFSRNLIISYLFESGFEKIFNAKANMKGCNLQILSGKLSWDEFEVADKNKPMQNLFQTGYSEVDFDLSSLFKGQLVCSNLQLDEIKFGTKRKESGALQEKPKKRDSKITNFALDYLKKQRESVPILTYKKMNVDSVLATCKLKTPGKVDSLRKVTEASKRTWVELLKNKNYSQKSKNIQKRFNNIDFDDPADVLKDLEKLYKESKTLYDESEEQRKQFEEQYNVLKTANSLNKWVQEDYNNVMKAVKFPNSQGYKLGEVLFGSSVYDIILQIVEALKTSRKTLNAEEPKSEQKIKFWLKKIKINSLLSDGTHVQGELINISNAQKLTEEPTIFNLKLNTAKNESAKIKGVLDYCSDLPKEFLQVDLEDVKIINLRLNQDVLPPKIDSALLDGNIKFTMQGENFNLKSELKFKHIVYSYRYEKSVSKQMKEIAKLVGNSAPSVWLSVDYNFANNSAKTSIKSSLDEVVKKALYEKFSSEKKELEKKLSKKINKGKYKKELDLLFKALDQDVANILLKDKPISDDQKNSKKGVADNIIKQGKKILDENSELKDKAKKIIKGLKF